MTLAEIDLLTVQYRRQQEREDRRAALGAWVNVEMNRDRETRGEPYTLEELVAWLGHGFQRHEAYKPVQPPTPEELVEQAKVLNNLYGGTTVNGHYQ
jgi:hypothetical protein